MLIWSTDDELMYIVAHAKNFKNLSKREITN